MSIEYMPAWLEQLDNEDLVFIKKFILSSGSLKDMAKIYDVTYPTVRLRLDRLIQKIELTDEEEEEPFITLIKKLAINDKIDYQTAKLISSEYRKERRKK